jgi:RimJ/RimL family protein N-acetyltransferase
LPGICECYVRTDGTGFKKKTTQIRENPCIQTMARVLDYVKASAQAGWGILHPSAEHRVRPQETKTLSVIVPIRSLGANHRGRIALHLLSLNERDRHLRFGYAAQNEQIRRYVEGLNFERDKIFGIYDRKLKLLAVAHLAYGDGQLNSAEFGVSVLAKTRNRGYGAQLFARAAKHACNEGVQTMFIHALTENAAMLKIAKNAGARLQRDGVESEAYLQLPQASLNSRISAIVQQQFAIADYRLKVKAQQPRSIAS